MKFIAGMLNGLMCGANISYYIQKGETKDMIFCIFGVLIGIYIALSNVDESVN